MAKRVAWLSDIHLNFLVEYEQLAFFASVRAQSPDAVVISGDVGEAPTIEGYLEMAEDVIWAPIYFVLGNHDFYRGSVAGVRERVAGLAARSAHLKYLSRAGAMPLTESTYIVGHDGWADARLGNYPNSQVQLNDFLLIEELTGHGRRELRRRLEALGDEAAEHFSAALLQVPDSCRQVLAVVHAPPFREACWYQGRITNDDWLPHFSCKAVGEVLKEFAARRPDCQVTVLCGHTHEGCEVRMLDNLTVLAASARYGKPAVQRMLEVK
jgi:3',5'-cyclic AMP phosphodiesterase CpdA